MYGIPNMKLPKEIVDRRIRLMEAEGVSFLLNASATPDLLNAYDAVLLCCGSRKPRSLQVDHMDVDGIYFAVDYLTAATQSVLSGTAPGITAQGKHVVVVGGGDTGNDCVGTALRQGCQSIVQLEMMPKVPENRPAGNPWPTWPRTLRTDYGQLEAISLQGSDPRVYETTVKSIRVNAENRITGLETVRLQKQPDGKLTPVPGTEQTLPCDLLLIAAGFIGCEEETLSRFSLSADARGRLLPKDGSHHLEGKLFSAGDMRSGQSLVVRSLADGRAAAKEIHAFLP
jgi:glutamate synthase (NADPH/NADH) small chain